MKKIFMVIVMMFAVVLPAMSEEVADAASSTVQATKTVYDIYSHEDLSANVLLGWGGLSLVSGGVMAFTGNNFARGMGIQNMLWGAADAGIAVWLKNSETERKSLRTRTEEEKWYRDMLALNFFIDFAYLAAGTGMMVWGNDDIKGHGAGILTQGLFLITFDGANWVISNNLNERYESAQ